MKNQTFKTIAAFLAIFGTAWVIKLTFLSSPKEVSYRIVEPRTEEVESLNHSERILTELDNYQALIDSTKNNDPSSSYVESPEKNAQDIWEMYHEARGNE